MTDHHTNRTRLRRSLVVGLVCAFVSSAVGCTDSTDSAGGAATTAPPTEALAALAPDGYPLLVAGADAAIVEVADGQVISVPTGGLPDPVRAAAAAILSTWWGDAPAQPVTDSIIAAYRSQAESISAAGADRGALAARLAGALQGLAADGSYTPGDLAMLGPNDDTVDPLTSLLSTPMPPPTGSLPTTMAGSGPSFGPYVEALRGVAASRTRGEAPDPAQLDSVGRWMSETVQNFSAPLPSPFACPTDQLAWLALGLLTSGVAMPADQVPAGSTLEVCVRIEAATVGRVPESIAESEPLAVAMVELLRGPSGPAPIVLDPNTATQLAADDPGVAALVAAVGDGDLAGDDLVAVVGLLATDPRPITQLLALVASRTAARCDTKLIEAADQAATAIEPMLGDTVGVDPIAIVSRTLSLSLWSERADNCKVAATSLGKVREVTATLVAGGLDGTTAGDDHAATVTLRYFERLGSCITPQGDRAAGALPTDAELIAADLPSLVQTAFQAGVAQLSSGQACHDLLGITP